MSESYEVFRERVARIYEDDGKAQRSRKKRHSVTVNRDGHFVIRGRARGPNIPWTGLMLVAVAFFGVKGAVMARVGPDLYSSNVGQLAPSSMLEQVGAWTMRPDPVSRWVAQKIKSIG